MKSVKNQQYFVARVVPFLFFIAVAGCQSNGDSNTNDPADDSESDDDTSPAPVCPIPTELKSTDISMITQDGEQSCFPKRLPWDPQKEMATCHLVLEYVYDQTDSATVPKCPTGNGQQWDNEEGELSKMSKIEDGESKDYFVRSCTVKKVPAPLNCADMTDNNLYANYETNGFAWFYCENPGENSAITCSDGRDNDLDGTTDEDDVDCAACITDDNCSTSCPYKVALTPDAAAAAVDAHSAQIVCLTQYRFETPGCTENTYETCNDNKDNDGNNVYDCWSFGKDNIEGKTPRIADPACCPMVAAPDTNECQFLNSDGAPTDVKDASHVAICDVGNGPTDIPDACCKAADHLQCVLPETTRATCKSRGL